MGSSGKLASASPVQRGPLKTDRSGLQKESPVAMLNQCSGAELWASNSPNLKIQGDSMAMTDGKDKRVISNMDQMVRKQSNDGETTPIDKKVSIETLEQSK